MKKAYRTVVSALAGFAFLLMSVTGCTLFDGTARDGVIRFTAASSLETKVYYGSEQDGKIRMVWETGDQIRIVSDRARTPLGGAYHDYRLRNSDSEHSNSGSSSFAKFDLDEAGENGLRWDESGDYEFYATYPPVNVSGNGAFEADVSSDEYLMVAHTTAAYNTQRNVFLRFYPAFTAIEVTIAADDADVTINDCELYSVSFLAGKFTAKIGDTGIYDFDLTQPTRSAYPSLTSGSGSSKTFTFFCLPQELKNVTVYCTFTKNGLQRTKSLYLSQSNESIRFAACKYHKLALTLDSSGGGGGEEFELTLGGAQLLLMTLRNNNTKIISGLKAYYGIGSDPWATYPNSDKFQAMRSSIMEKTSSNADQFIKDHYWEADKVFNGNESFSFTAEELAVLKEAVLPLITDTGTIGQEDYSKITSDIVASDFTWLPNLERINHLETNQNLSPRPSLSISDLSSLQSVELNQYTFVNIDGCGGSNGVSVSMSNANNVAGELVLKNMKINGQINIGNQHMIGPVIVENVTGMTSATVGNLTSAQFKNCPDLQSINLSTARDLTDFTVENCSNFTTFSIGNAGSSFQRITLRNTPKFERGTAGDNMNNFTVTLRECSGDVPSGTTPYIQLNNTQISNVTVSKDPASSRVEVRANGGTK